MCDLNGCPFCDSALAGGGAGGGGGGFQASMKNPPFVLKTVKRTRNVLQFLKRTEDSSWMLEILLHLLPHLLQLKQSHRRDNHLGLI
jgi:hypothetical protein